MSEQGMPPEGGPPSPEQEELMRQMEEEMRQVRVQDLVTQSVVSILNLTARRIAKDDERDLEQARVGIEAVRAMVDLLEPEAAQEVRNALSQVQMMYAQHSGSDPGAGEPPSGEDPGGRPPPGGAPPGGTGGPEQGGPGGQEPPSRLWTPGSG